MAWAVEDCGREDGVGIGDGSGGEHGVDKCWAIDVPRFEHQGPLLARGRRDVQGRRPRHRRPRVPHRCTHLRLRGRHLVRPVPVLQRHRQLQRRRGEAGEDALAIVVVTRHVQRRKRAPTEDKQRQIAQVDGGFQEWITSHKQR